MIDIKDVEYVAKLAKINIEPDEKEPLLKDMQNIITFADILTNINTDDIEPTYHIFDIQNTFRDDVITNDDTRDNLMQNAPSKFGGYFVVPKVVE